MTKRKLVGHIGVDAGLCWVGDPCYILHQDKPLPPSLGTDWLDFCEKLGKEHPTMKSFPYALGHEGLGVCVSTGFGDGKYPVYAEISDEGDWGKRVKSITVVFIEDDETEDRL
jgi:hypothetical protein